MKTLILTMLFCTTSCIVGHAQTKATKPASPAEPATTVYGNGYAASTPFLIFSKNASSEYAIALGVRQENGVKVNVLLFKHKALNYNAELDTSATYLDVQTGVLHSEKGKTWSDDDYIRLKRSALQPSSNLNGSNGYVRSFDMPDSVVADMRNMKIWELALRDEGYPGYGNGSGVTYRIDEKARNLFITYATKMTGGTSIFTPLASFIKKPIPMASLFHQPKSYVDSVLGAPVKDTDRNGTIFTRYITNDGTYEAEFKSEMVVRVKLWPVYKFFMTNDLSTPGKSPFELTARAGENFPIVTKDCQHTAKDPKRKRMEYAVEKEERFDRYVTLVTVDEVI